MRLNTYNIKENIDPELQWAIDNSYRTDPELRNDILDSLKDEELESYVVNVEHGDVKFKLSPDQILEKLTGLSDLGNIVTTMRGGNGVAVLTDKDLVVKITGDEAEYITAKELENVNNEHVVKVHQSQIIDADDQSIYTSDSKPAYLIIMDKVDAPTMEQERDWFDCCCTEDKPIYIDFTNPNSDVFIHPPVDDYEKCNKIYDDIMNIRKAIESVGRRWVDIGIDNVGIKDGKYVLIDLGTNDPLPLNETREIITEGFFDILSNLFKKPEQKSDTPDELTQYLQELQTTLDKNKIYDEEVGELVNELKDSDYIDLVDFPTMLRGLQNKLLKSGDKNEIVIDYLTRLNKSLPKRAKYEKKLLQGQVPLDSEYYDEIEQEKSRIPKKVFRTEKELLQIELLKLQEWVKKNNVPVAVVFEGRDTAGKGSTIKKLTQYLDPKYFTIVALGIPTEEEKQNWFQRYEKYIEPGKITFFDRSWYNRGIVEPVMGYSSKEEYEQFMDEVVPFEKSLLSQGVILIKFWLSITQGKQEQRFTIRQQSPLKYWKYSPNDEASREKWDEYTDYKERVLKDTSHVNAPWVVLDSNDKRMSALNAMRHLLDQVDYDGKELTTIRPKYPEAISTIRRKIDEDTTLQESALPSSSLTTAAQRVLQVALDMSIMENPHAHAAHRGNLVRMNLVKFFNVMNSVAEDMAFITEYNMNQGNEKVEDWIIPTVYESIFYVYGDYDNETFYEDCQEDGTTWEGDECECIKGDIWDEEEEDYRACTDSELEEVHYDDECKCDSWDEVEVEKYSYPIMEKTIYTTEDPQEIGCDGDTHDDIDDFIRCMDRDDGIVRVMNESHHDDTPPERYDDFEEDLDQTIAYDEYSPEYDEFEPHHLIRSINAMFTDVNLPDQPSPLNEEEQLSLFPTGDWIFPVGTEEEDIIYIKQFLPDNIVKIIFERWDKEEPLTLSNVDFKLLGLPKNNNRLLIALVVRYLQNTTRPIPVTQVWDCLDLQSLFDKDDKDMVTKYLCEEDYDHTELMYGYDEWDDGMPDQLDEKSWGLVTKILGVDESIAENLLKDKPQTQAEEELLTNKEDDVDKIRDLLRWSNERAASDTTYTAIRDSIKDEIEDHFEQEGKFEYNSKGELVYIIEDDLKNWVQEDGVWDNTDRFPNHEDFGGQHLEDMFYSLDFTPSSPESRFKWSIPNKIFNIFMEEKYDVHWNSDTEWLTVDSKFSHSYWYPTYDINEHFQDYMNEEFYDELHTQPEPMNEGIEDKFDEFIDAEGAFVEETPITKTEANILNMVYKNFTITELSTLIETDFFGLGANLEKKWRDFIKLLGEVTPDAESFVKSTRWAKWALDNMEEAEDVNEDGEVIIDFHNVDNLVKNYPSLYEVLGDESMWEKVYRSATVEIPAFNVDDARQRAEDHFWEYDPEMETYDYGDSDSDVFNIEDVNHYQTLKEQIIDTENLSDEELSPDLKVGDKVFVWDIEVDPAPPGGTSDPIPSTVIGTVVHVYETNAQEEPREDSFRGGIKYDIDTSSGILGLYQGGGKRRRGWWDGDKWVKLNKKNLQEIKKISRKKNIERQKDFILKKSFMESVENLSEKDITPIKESVVESRVILFNHLDLLSKKTLMTEQQLSHFLIGGKNWVDKFSITTSLDLDLLKENSNKVRDIIFNNTQLKLSTDKTQPSFRETKIGLLETAISTTQLWKKTSDIIFK